MNPGKVKQIVSGAFDLEASQREPFVRNACGDDPSLLAEVLSLLDVASHAEEHGLGLTRLAAIVTDQSAA